MNKKIKKIIKLSLLFFVIASIAFAVITEVKKQKTINNKANNNAINNQTTTQKSIKEKDVKIKKNKIIAYYFHGNARCHSCLLIEKLSHEAINKKFAKELQEGILEWKVINIETPGNSHFIKDYNLYTKSLIISTVKNGIQKSWKNLEKVWEYLDDKNKFYSYVQTEVAKSLAG